MMVAALSESRDSLGVSLQGLPASKKMLMFLSLQ